MPLCTIKGKAPSKNPEGHIKTRRILILLVLGAAWAKAANAHPLFKEQQLRELAEPLPPLNLSQDQADATFAVSYAPEGRATVPLAALHAWRVEVHPRDGRTDGVSLELSAAMPRHRHGLPTTPKIQALGAGVFRVEGLEFHMPGWWRVSLCAARAGKRSCFAFDLDLKANLSDLTLAALPPVPTEARRNEFVGRPLAAELGRAFFFDRSLSATGQMACATCHDPAEAFASRALFDAGQGPRSVPSLRGVAWGTFYFWDGRADALWAQATHPLLSPREAGLVPSEVRRKLLARYAPLLLKALGERTANRIRRDRSGAAAVEAYGKAVAAYVATLRPEESSFDRFAQGHGGLGACAQLGLAVFRGKGRCENCHNGPRLTNDAFHNTGAPLNGYGDEPAGRARVLGREDAEAFSCAASDGGAPVDCRHAEFRKERGLSLVGAFKTPSLRGVKDTAPYLHNGALPSLEAVVRHYETAPDGPIGSSELLPLTLTDDERRGLVCFLETL